MEAANWLLLFVAIVVGIVVILDAHEPRAESDEDEVTRMLDLGQQPGSWEP